MARRVIRLGDPTTHGGIVVSAAPDFEIDGKRVARRGDKVTCPIKGHGVAVIVEGDKDWTIGGQPVALEGHKTSCGASLISTLATLERSYEGAGGAGMSVALTDAPAPKGTTRSVAGGADGDGTAVVTGLGPEADRLVAKSPSLQKDLQKLDKEKWEIQYGPVSDGSAVDRRNSVIMIYGSEKGDPVAAIQSLAHEIGHATYPYTPDYSSRNAYVNGALADEGAATLNNIKVRREIMANGGPDIGIAGNSANHAAYDAAYDQYLKDGNAAAARQAIGAKFGAGETTSNTGQPYADYYGGWYERAYSTKK